MKQTSLKTLAVAALAAVCFTTPIAANAQRYGHRDRDGDRYDYNRRGLSSHVDRIERESNSFRDFFEHNFKSNGHPERWDRSDRYNSKEHEGKYGQMTLRDSIQNLDEDFERLRSEVDHHGSTPEARDLMNEIMDHSHEVDQRISRAPDFYFFSPDRNRSWRYDRSELSRRWSELRRDINELGRDFRR